MIQFTYLPRLPWLLAGVACVLLLLWLSFRTAKGRPTPVLKAGLISLRLLAVILVVLCLLDPQWVETIKRQPKTRVAVLLDNSQSMGIRDVAPSRFEVARDWISQKVVPAAPAGVSLPMFSFSSTLASLPAVSGASPTGAVTALAAALETTLMVPAEDPLTGVILVSDGIENVSHESNQVVRAYRQKGIPIHTVTVGTTNEMKDIIVENVQVKRAVPNEAPTRVSLSIRSPGFKDKTVTLQIRGQKELLASRDVTLNGGSQKLEVEITPKQKGFQVYEVTIDQQPGEWLTSNNRRLFALEVVDPTIHVLYMEGTPQQAGSPIPEWKYLKDALESDPNIKVKTLYRAIGNTGQHLNTVDTDPLTGEKIYPVEHPSKGFPKTMAALMEYDVIIHSDIRKESFSNEQLKNMATLVEEHGGGFVMIGGNSAFGKGGYHRTILDRIIPVAMEQENDSQSQAVKMLVPRAAANHPVINIGSTKQETELIWTTKLPFLFGYNRIDRAKPGAVVLGLNPGYQNQFGQGVMLAVQDIGKGRSMAFASDTTRSWGRDFETLWGEPLNRAGGLTEGNCDSRYYRQFWVNAMRWLANGKVGKTNNAVTLELAQSYCSTNESVTARVKVRDGELHDVANAEVSLLVSAGNRTNTPVRARFDAASGSYVASVRPGTAGSFIVQAVAQRGAAPLGDDRQLLVAESVDQEMADLRARPEYMALLARETGGTILAMTNAIAASPAYIFANAPAPTVEYKRKPFWDKPVWLALILGLLAAEWGLRRMKGLA